MPKRIVFCADGTWQAPVNNTNVYRLYKALLVTSDQVTIYDDGVGADATGRDRLLEGAFGQSLFQKIMDGYTSIAHVYEPGDQIYFFGFSRGAYTVRSLAGMIANCGVPRGSFTNECVSQCFAAYRSPAQRETILAGLSAYGLADATITMVGVWDTVGSLGIPAIFGGIDKTKFGFLDTKLHPDVKNAYQCLAIDEQRVQFAATLWDPLPAPALGQLPVQTLEQVWFSGCHGDVGGGTSQGSTIDNGTRLCDITMGYMVAKAQALGLTFDPAIAARYGTLPSEFSLDPIRQTWNPTDGPPHLRPVAPNALVSNSVAVRIQYALTYTPGNLTINAGMLSGDYSLLTLVDTNAL
jgi:uncharacterized protein (DUF2235 family)